VDIVALALQEDIKGGDKSAELLDDNIITAEVISRDEAIICGLEYFTKCFNDIEIHWNITSGEQVAKNTILCTLTGNNKEIITKERTALNFLQLLSGIATKTHYLSQKIKHTHTQILDTRKTIPLLRKAQKEAVICGGGSNHRFGLYDAIMLKENHISQLGITQAVKYARQQYPHIDIIVEVENLKQLREANNTDITRILCDNFDIQMLKEAVTISHKPLEASGNIDKNNIVAYAETGVDFISLGDLTKNIHAIDLSLNILN
jgi:nicotinate-nucleotide pyrophosphorylase (carboxylating)